MSTHEVSIPFSLRKILEDFGSCFTKPGYQNFATLIDGWIMCQARHGISRVIQASRGLETGKHFSTFYRFLSHGRWAVDAVAKTLFQLLAKLAQGNQLTLIIDDTVCHKTGPHLFGGAMHFDSHKSTYGRGTDAGRKGFFAFGHNWVVAALWIPLPWDSRRGIAVPFAFRLYRSKKQAPAKKYRKRTELAKELIALVGSWLPEGRTLRVLGDAEYACKAIVRSLPAGMEFSGPVCMDAAIFELPPSKSGGRGRPAKRGKKLPSPKKLAESKSIAWTKSKAVIYGREVDILTKTILCLWYTVAHIRPVRIVITRDPKGRLGDRAYFTTETDLSAAEVLELYARRWEIEVSFRNTKQCMGLESPQNGWWRRLTGDPRPKKKAGPNPKEGVGELAVHHALAMGFAAHAIVILWYWKHGNAAADVSLARKSAPWYRQKTAPSFYDMLAALRREIWAERISAHPLVAVTATKIKRLLPPWLLVA